MKDSHFSFSVFLRTEQKTKESKEKSSPRQLNNLPDSGYKKLEFVERSTKELRVVQRVL